MASVGGTGVSPGADTGERRLTHVCLITDDVVRLARFYADILQCPAETFGDQYAEVPAPGSAVSSFRTDAVERLAPGAARAGANRSMVLKIHEAASPPHRRRPLLIQTFAGRYRRWSNRGPQQPSATRSQRISPPSQPFSPNWDDQL